jgi:uncharacterized oxidoreductase
MPTYCASKAALHSYTQSLRWQLRETPVEVLEIIPPYVQTELGGPSQAVDPRAMPLKDFIAETMQIIQSQPEQREICVEKARGLRFAEANGTFDAAFQALSQMSFGLRGGRRRNRRLPRRTSGGHRGRGRCGYRAGLKSADDVD